MLSRPAVSIPPAAAKCATCSYGNILFRGHPVPAPATALGPGERLLRFLLSRWPLGALVRWVARLHISVHAKLLGAFLLVAGLFIATGAVSLQIVKGMSRQTRLLDEAHTRVDASRRIEHALAMQMKFTAMALLLRDEATIASILRENNRFNDTLAQIERPLPPTSESSSSESAPRRMRS